VTWLGAHRRGGGVIVAAVLLIAATLVLTSLRNRVTLAADLAIYLLIVVLTSIVGGFYPALAAAVAGSLLLNYYFAPPLHTLTVNAGQNALALAIFLIVAVLVSRVVHVARTVRPLAESDRARTALLNAVSHDLRTPIASAKAAVSSLRAQDVAWSDADRDELLAAADASLDRLTDLVTNLLDLSRLQAGVLPVSAAPVGLGDVVSRALDHLCPAPAAVRVDVPDELPAVLADAGLLERVVANLVQNALRFSPAGRPVTVRGATRDGAVELRVVDSGPGFADEPQFAPFQRRDDSPVPGEGVGLGLAVVRGLTEAMGGTVAAERTPGGGATLVVRLAAGGER
jgi:two-component system sensor histidine kinase KdpD